MIIQIKNVANDIDGLEIDELIERVEIGRVNKASLRRIAGQENPLRGHVVDDSRGEGDVEVEDDASCHRVQKGHLHGGFLRT